MTRMKSIDDDERIERDAFADAFERRLRDDLDGFLANAEDDDFNWSQDDGARANVWRPPLGAVVKALCAACLIGVACLVAWTTRTRSTTDVMQSAEIARNVNVRTEASETPAVKNEPSSVLTDVLTLVDYDKPRRVEDPDAKSLGQLGEQGADAISDCLADYAFTRPRDAFGSTLKVMAAAQRSKSNRAANGMRSELALDNALMTCVNSSSEVNSFVRYDPFFWAITVTLADNR